MHKIFRYIKNGQGIGALWILLFSALVAFSAAYSAQTLLPIAVPHIQLFADTFFPLRVQNSKVIVPQNTIISKTYHVNGEPLTITLNTTKDLLDETDKQTGLYLTRSYLYSITDNQIQRQELTADFNLEKRDYVPLLNNLIKYIVRGIVLIGPFFNFIFFMVAVVFYAFLTGFACALNKVTLPFKGKMRLNTVLFIGVYIISTLLGYVGFYLSTLSFFLIMLALQIIVVKTVGTPIEQKETNVKS